MAFWRPSGDGSSGTGFPQPFQYLFGLGLAVFETSHTVVMALDVIPSEPVQVEHETDGDGGGKGPEDDNSGNNPLGYFRRNQCFLTTITASQMRPGWCRPQDPPQEVRI